MAIIRTKRRRLRALVSGIALSALSGCAFEEGASITSMARDDHAAVPAPSPLTNAPTGVRRIFVSAPIAANFASVAAADAHCNSDASRPNTSLYKAMIALPGARSAAGGVMVLQIDWVLHPDTTYLRADGTTTIGTTTNAAVFDFYSVQASIADATTPIWTGMYANWTDGVSTNNCASWTSNATSTQAWCGIGSGTDATMISSAAAQTCANSFALYCVEQ